MKKNMEFVPMGIVEMLDQQSITPYCMCSGVDELLRAYPYQTTHKMSVYMFQLGYIEGKRAERARKNGRMKC